MKVLVAGHRGMVGAALCRELHRRGGSEILTADRAQLDLRDQPSTFAWLEQMRPDAVIVAAAKVGGIHANATLPAEFIYDNLAIAANTIEASRRAGVERLLFLGSSCIYPRDAPQPIAESCLLSSPLERTNEAYAIAKIAGLELCRFYREQYGLTYHSAMPTNLYGAGDNYHPENSHVIPGLIRRMHEAKVRGDAQVVIWGTGTPRREFLHVDDLARACLLLVAHENPPDWVNVGSGEDITILQLAERIAEVVGFSGSIATDPSKPDGTPRKILDVSLIKGLGWRPRVGLEEGLQDAYNDYLEGLDAGTIRVA
ncbi:MAG: GDP-L-fucose synthase [Akkermansiaceae bacterium]|nr:GDP-L-fucose synthase [Akkermansiaceae bacterium]